VLKLSDLARRPDFKVGPVLVSPSRRLVEGPAGKTSLEPLVMQVFLMLLDARGQVVSRDELFNQVWGGAMVGDDSLNRAVARVRRIEAERCPGLFEVETIPRTGYRLTIDSEAWPEAGNYDGKDIASEAPRFTRRSVAGAVAVAGIAAGGLGLWSIHSREDREFNELMGRGEEALEYGDPSSNAAPYFRRAVAIRPENAKAQGLLAYSQALRAEKTAEPGGANKILLDAERAGRSALSLKPNEPHALLAQVILQLSSLDFFSTEDRLRAILADAPDNIHVMRHLWDLMQCVGRSHDALALVGRATAIRPLAAFNHYPRAQLLWILGRNAEADRVIDQAMEFWPSHRYVRFARFTIFAFTGRPRAALAMLDGKGTAPQNYSPASIALWRVSLLALDQRTPASIAAAVRANVAAAEQDLKLSAQAVLTLSALGEVDAAFELANSLLLFRDPVETQSSGDTLLPRVTSTAWRFAPWLFTPPVASLRADPRFAHLCDGIGLSDYWRKRGVKPDYQSQTA
jgi:DNA-binding winged helix-turn-helix (wHTH) protein/thioredoxin-like negative regulator of GroEL